MLPVDWGRVIPVADNERGWRWGLLLQWDLTGC